MLNSSRTLTALAIAASLGVGAAHTQAHAALIAEEYFDYGPDADQLRDFAGGSGWADNWGNVNATTGYEPGLNITPAVTGYSNGGNVGGSATFFSTTGTSTNIHARDFPATGGTVWFSAAINTTSANDRVLLWIDATESAPNSLDFIGVSAGNPFFRYNGSSTVGSEDTPVGSFLVVAKAEVNVGGTVNDSLTYWFNPSDATSEATLNATAAEIFSGSSANAFPDGIEGIAIQFFGTGLTPGSIDAIRVGTELSDVTGFVIPEPASLALLGLGSVLIAGRRRR